MYSVNEPSKTSIMAMLMAFPSGEKTPLKRPRLGPPDVYPQDPKQKEDELSHSNVKHGFNYAAPQLNTDEFGTAQKYDISAAKLNSSFTNILDKKEELNTLPDTGRKKAQLNPKDNFWPVVPRSKPQLESWFRGLAGDKSLSALAKKVPVIHKKEEIFQALWEDKVPMIRAAWFIKMTSAYNVAISETKIKKRQPVDPSQEWTQMLTKYLWELLCKLAESYSSNNNTTEIEQWRYSTDLTRFLYEEGLLDRQELLTWLLELVERFRSADDCILRVILPLLLQYMNDFTNSELLSRKLTYAAARKISQLVNDNQNCSGGPASPRTHSPIINNPPNGNTVNHSGSNNSLSSMFGEFTGCHHYRSIILSLSCIVQVVALDCPSALVWSCIGDGKVNSALNASPLDLLPCSPSALPMPPRPDNTQVRAQLRLAEAHIRNRSQAAEDKWASEKMNSTTGSNIHRVLAALDTLDRHSFDRVDNSNSLDTLYSKIFPPSAAKESGIDPLTLDEPIVKMLCEWATCTQRSGEHRAMVVARLLDKRQSELTSTDLSSLTSDTGDGGSPAHPPQPPNPPTSGLPTFQNLLMNFLDTQAPVIDDNPSREKRIMFGNVVLLYGELIRADVFSHDAYLCSLISRGELTGDSPLPRPPPPLAFLNDTHMLDKGPPKTQHDTSDIKMELDDSKIDDDLGKLLQHISQNKMEGPDSPKDEGEAHLGGGRAGDRKEDADSNKPHTSRHLLYTTNFPLPMDESSSHEINQRHILLYGVGRARDEAKHTVKKISKEIAKLFEKKKFGIDVTDGKVKKQSKSEINFENWVRRFCELSYFDQHAVTGSCAGIVVEMLASFSQGGSVHLPVQEHVAFMFDLMEIAQNITGLIDFCIQLLKELPEVEAGLLARNSSLVGNYTTSLSLYVCGVLRRYHCCLLVSQDWTAWVFEGLCKVVKRVTNPADCTSAERCILAHLYDLYTSCSFLKSKHYESRFEPFSNAYPKIKQTLYAEVQPSNVTLKRNPQFMMDYLTSPRKRLEPSLVKQLNEVPASRYSFVCNAVVSVCNATDNDRLNDISVLSAEATACCNALSAEWLGVLSALLCSSMNPIIGGFIDVLTEVEVSDLSIYNSLAVFTSILIARHCFSLHDLAVHVALPACLVVAFRQGKGDSEAESRARLACHLLLHLFRTVDSPHSYSYLTGGSSNQMLIGACPRHVALSCDRHLLSAAHTNTSVGAVFAVLKAILVLSDNEGEPPISAILGTSDLMGGDSDMKLDLGGSLKKPSSTRGGGLETASLSEFARHVLLQICSQGWVRERCLQIHEEQLCSQDYLLDNKLSTKQAQRLLHMICRPDSPISFSEDSTNQKQAITHILERLEGWTLRVSWLELQLMLKQVGSSSADMKALLEAMAQATVDLFLTHTPSNEEQENKPLLIASNRGKKEKENKSIWLVAPLVAKLPNEVQGKVLCVSTQLLEKSSYNNQKGVKDGTMRETREGRERQERERVVGAERGEKDIPPRIPTLVYPQPFLSLIHTCLRTQEDQKGNLIESLHTQLEEFLNKKFYNQGAEDQNWKQQILESLQLRFSLLGSLFDAIQTSTSSIQEWAILLVQLVSHSVVDLNNNTELFTTVLDMLSTLIHSTLVGDSSSTGEENKRSYQTLVKKLKKELQERDSPSLTLVRQLLPLPKVQIEMMCTLADAKGNRKQDLDAYEKPQGLQLLEKQKVSPWDVLEGMRSPAPLSWAWLCATRHEKKPMRYEDSFRLQLYHTHAVNKSAAYYLDPPPLPQEDLEPHKQKGMEEVHNGVDTPNSDPSGRGGLMMGYSVKGNKNKPNKRIKRVPKYPNGNAMPAPSMPHGNVPQVNFPNGTMYSNPGHMSQSWGPNPNQPSQGGSTVSHPYGTQPTYYSTNVSGSMPGTVAAPGRYNTSNMSSPRQAIHSMLHNRGRPNTQFLPPNNTQAQQGMAPQQPYSGSMDMIRKSQPMIPGAGIRPGTVNPASQPGMNYPHMNQMYAQQSIPQQGMTGSYMATAPTGGYGGPRPMNVEGSGGVMMPSQGYQTPQQGMVGMRSQTQPYLNQTQTYQQPMGQPRATYGMANSGNMQPGAPMYTRMPGMTQQQQLHAVARARQQQILAMQQGQVPNTQPQSNASFLATHYPPRQSNQQPTGMQQHNPYQPY